MCVCVGWGWGGGVAGTQSQELNKLEQGRDSGHQVPQGPNEEAINSGEQDPHRFTGKPRMWFLKDPPAGLFSSCGSRKTCPGPVRLFAVLHGGCRCRM